MLQSICPRCKKSFDKHRIPFIESQDNSQKLLNRLQKALEKKNQKEIIKAYPIPERTTSMMGAAIAKISGGASKKYVTLSGPGFTLLNSVDINAIGKEVTLVKIRSASLLDKTIDISGNNFEPIWINRETDYPFGSCAAQKLLWQIFTDAKAQKKEVETIDMTERLWKDFRAEKHNKAWSTGLEPAPSCDTCKQVLPQMLCDWADD